MAPTSILLPGKSHGWRSLAVHGVSKCCSPWGLEESDMTERLHFHFSLSCIGEGNGSPLQCSRLENPRDGGAWWAAVYGVTQSRTRLKQLSSSPNQVLIKLPALRFPYAHPPTLVFLTNVLTASFNTKYNGPLWLNLWYLSDITNTWQLFSYDITMYLDLFVCCSILV